MLKKDSSDASTSEVFKTSEVCLLKASWATNMEPSDLRELLEQVQSGGLSVSAALDRLEAQAVANLGYANVDLHRPIRCGFPEVIFCPGKTSAWVEGVVRKLLEAQQD